MKKFQKTLSISVVTAFLSLPISHASAQPKPGDVVLFGKDSATIVSVKWSGANTEVPDSILYKLDLYDVCKLLEIQTDKDPETLLRKIVVPLCKEGIVLFSKNSDPYLKNISQREFADRAYGVSGYCFCYSGTTSQKQKLKHNLIVNRKLIKQGRLISGAAKKWRIVP